MLEWDKYEQLFKKIEDNIFETQKSKQTSGENENPNIISTNNETNPPKKSKKNIINTEIKESRISKLHLEKPEDEIIEENCIVPDCADDESDDIDQALIIDLELVKYRENNPDNNKFYLLFNYRQGEISYYYLCVKKFKENAKLALKSFLGQK